MFVAFAATQIIIATMFLRWHYLIDIVAGLTLATTAALLSYAIVKWETKRRREAGLPPTFSIIEWPWTRPGAGAHDDGDPTLPAA
jgi:membrane-associated phospholipid phosphatase